MMRDTRIRHTTHTHSNWETSLRSNGRKRGVDVLLSLRKHKTESKGNEAAGDFSCCPKEFKRMRCFMSCHVGFRERAVSPDIDSRSVKQTFKASQSGIRQSRIPRKKKLPFSVKKSTVVRGNANRVDVTMSVTKSSIKKSDIQP